MTASQVKLRKGFSYNYRRIQHTKKLTKNIQDSSSLNSTSLPSLTASDLTSSPIKLTSSPLKRSVQPNHNNVQQNAPELESPQRDSPVYLENLIRSIFINSSSSNGNNNNALLQKLVSSSLPLQSSKATTVTKEVPLSEHLPALTSSSKIDLSLYALIGLFIREFIMSWYNRLVMDENQDFMNELIGVSAHITRGIQQRCNNPELDWGKILFDDIPVLLIRHLESFKEAERRVESRFTNDLEEGNLMAPQLALVNAFIQLNPHFCLNIEDYRDNVESLAGDLNGSNEKSEHKAQQDGENLVDDETADDEDDEGRENEYSMDRETQYNRVLTKTIVSLLLPFEELDSGLSREFVNSIVSDMIIKNIIENLSDNFAIWGMIGNIVDILDGSNNDDDDIGKNNHSNGGGESKIPIWNFKENMTSIGRRVGHIIAYSTSVFSKADKKYSTSGGTSSSSDGTRRGETNILDYAVFSLITKILGLCIRYPIIMGFLQVFIDFISRSEKVLHLLNNLLYNFIWNILLTEGMICSLINNLRKLFFPQDLRFTTNKRYVPDTLEELESVRVKTKCKISSFIQGKKLLMRTIYTDSEELELDIDDFLNCLSNKYINKHLLWNIIDLLLIKLFPESTFQTPSEIINH